VVSIVTRNGRTSLRNAVADCRVKLALATRHRPPDCLSVVDTAPVRRRHTRFGVENTREVGEVHEPDGVCDLGDAARSLPRIGQRPLRRFDAHPTQPASDALSAFLEEALQQPSRGFAGIDHEERAGVDPLAAALLVAALVGQLQVEEDRFGLVVEGSTANRRPTGGYKARLVSSSASDTCVTSIFGPEWPDVPMRVLRNQAVRRAEGASGRPHATEVDPIGRTRLFGIEYVMPPNSAVLPTRDTEGDLEAMCLVAGTSEDGVHAVRTVAEIVAELMEEC
jgi:hypothetical protein